MTEFSLTGRKMHCSYSGCKTLPSDSNDKAPFFEYRGPGSWWATALCVCGFSKKAHDEKIPHVIRKCKEFQPRGPHETDTYYCGCFGWD